jgi:hypothetical protein
LEVVAKVRAAAATEKPNDAIRTMMKTSIREGKGK